MEPESNYQPHEHEEYRRGYRAATREWSAAVDRLEAECERLHREVMRHLRMQTAMYCALGSWRSDDAGG